MSKYTDELLKKVGANHGIRSKENGVSDEPRSVTDDVAVSGSSAADIPEGRKAFAEGIEFAQQARATEVRDALHLAQRALDFASDGWARVGNKARIACAYNARFSMIASEINTAKQANGITKDFSIVPATGECAWCGWAERVGLQEKKTAPALSRPGPVRTANKTPNEDNT